MKELFKEYSNKELNEIAINASCNLTIKIIDELQRRKKDKILIGFLENINNINLIKT